MKRLLVIFLLFCTTVSQQKNNYANVDPLEKLKNILLSGEHKFNVFELSKEKYFAENKLNNTSVDLETSKIILSNENSAALQRFFKENQKNGSTLKQLDYTINYNIINSNSNIILDNNDNRAPKLTINLLTNEIKLQNVSNYLTFKKEISVNNSDNIFNSEWSGFYWENDVLLEKRIYRNSVTVGVLKNQKKIYIKVTTYKNKDKKTFFFISV